MSETAQIKQALNAFVEQMAKGVQKVDLEQIQSHIQSVQEEMKLLDTEIFNFKNKLDSKSQ